MQATASPLSSFFVNSFGQIGVNTPGFTGQQFVLFNDRPDIALQFAMHKDLEYIRTIIGACPWTNDIVNGYFLLSQSCSLNFDQAAECVRNMWLQVSRNCIDHNLPEYIEINAVSFQFLYSYGAFNSDQP